MICHNVIPTRLTQRERSGCQSGPNMHSHTGTAPSSSPVSWPSSSIHLFTFSLRDAEIYIMFHTFDALFLLLFVCAP